MQLPADFLSRLRAIVGEGNLLTDAASCYVYGYDNSRKVFPPQAVVFATDTDTVRDVVRLCNIFRVPLTPRGRGTGTTGASIPERGGVALSLERMRRILHVDPANRMIVAEPGVLNQEIQDAARPHGFFWPPDPSSAAYCSIGGNLGTCAGGPHAVKYGVTRDHVLGLTAVTGKGEIIKTGCHTTKGVVGYDLTRLLVGSEGTLAVITEAILKLTPLPATLGGLTAHYRDIASCAVAIAAIMAQPAIPSALEFLDQASLDLVRGRHPGLVPDETRALLMIEVDGSPAEVAANAQAIRAVCSNDGLIQAEIVSDLKALWIARKALSPLLRDIAPKKINEDVVVPVSRLPELLGGLAELSAKYRVANANFGHAGNGNIHVNLLVNPDDTEQMARAEACLDEIFALVLRLDGTLSGEHGVGREKRPFVAREIDPVTMGLMRDIKRAFDPADILNPGKMFPPGMNAIS
jgi:D-lactate dehydrogenase (quinone)